MTETLVIPGAVTLPGGATPDYVSDLSGRLYESSDDGATVTEIDASGVVVELMAGDPTRFYLTVPLTAGVRNAVTFIVANSIKSRHWQANDLGPFASFFVLPIRATGRTIANLKLIFEEERVESAGATVSTVGTDGVVVKGWAENTNVRGSISWEAFGSEGTEEWRGGLVPVTAGDELIGPDHEVAVLAYLRQELTFSVLTADRPRDHELQTGGYGIDLTAYAGRLPRTFGVEHDELCPIVAEGWSDPATGESIGAGNPYAPFTKVEIDEADHTTLPGGANLLGSGYMVLRMSDGDEDGAETAFASGLGVESEVGVSAPIILEIKVPKGRGTGQFAVHVELVSTVLVDRRIDVNADAYLWQFGGIVPRRVSSEKGKAYRSGTLRAPFERIQHARSAIGQ